MSLPAGIAKWNIKKFRNAHQNFTQELDENQSYQLYLNDPEWQGLSSLEQYNKCTENIQWIIKEALDRDMSLRAMGSGWSFTKVAVSDDIIINTKMLRHRFKLNQANFKPEFKNSHDISNYHFLQCGNTIIKINEYLEHQQNPAKSLRSSGGSNGQTVVGAFSTNTHGASINYGAISEMIKGMHIVTGPDKHYYIERASEKITSTSFHNKINAEYIADDALFNAALVSFGSFGFIHGVLLEVEDKFLLEQKLTRVKFDQRLENALSKGEYEKLQPYLLYQYSDQNNPLYHVEIAINPHDFKFDDLEKGAYLRIMHKVKYRDNYNRIDNDANGYTYGDDALGLIQSVLNMVEHSAGFLNRKLIPLMVNKLFKTAYERPENAIGTIGETFKNTVFRGKVFSAAFGFDPIHLKEVIQLCLEVNKKTKLAGIMACRFLKGTKATMGFTKWPSTCVLELDGGDVNINYSFVKKLALRMEAKGIVYTMHWGKINRHMNESRCKNSYGEANVLEWKKQRSRLMDESVQAIFNNEFLEQFGLDEYIPYSSNTSQEFS